MEAYQNQNLKMFEKIFKEIQLMREEMTVRDHQFDRRLCRLESHLPE